MTATSVKIAKQATITIADTPVTPGSRVTIQIPVARLYTHTKMTMPVHVIHGRRPGPVLFVSGTVHGDEIIGIEIIRRLIALKKLDRLKGTLIAVPVAFPGGCLSLSLDCLNPKPPKNREKALKNLRRRVKSPK